MAEAAPAIESEHASTPVGSRHPDDPDVVRSTKAVAVLVLGIVAALTGPLLGGLVPAAIALTLAGPLRSELVAGRGYLTGSRQLSWGVALSWTGVVLATLTVVSVAMIFAIRAIVDTGMDFPDTSN